MNRYTRLILILAAIAVAALLLGKLAFNAGYLAGSA
jgi:hypothetical protein